MDEFELFQSALDLDDPAARKSFLKSACGPDTELLNRVESLLTSHEGQSQFLETPVIEQISDAGNAARMLVGDGSTQEETLDITVQYPRGSTPMTEHDDDSDNETPLGYLEPSSKPGSLGRLGHYEVLEVVGRGAFGTVLRAFDEKLQRVVAIKVMSPEMASTSPARKRFLREAQASAAIRHEHVVSVYAVEEMPIPYLVMEYIPGLTLQKRLDERGPLDVPTVLRLGRQIAEGLAAAHSQGLIHRDIKPGNILLEAGILDKVKITDFGLARAADDASLTQSGTIAGTPMYMAPEQAMGHKLDQRADLFSFGSVLYQMVSGRPPFRAPSALAVLKRVVEETPRPIREIIPETPQWLCDIITKLHAKKPDDRYQSAREVADVLADCEVQLKANARLQDFSRIPSSKSASSSKWKLFTSGGVVGTMLLLGVIIITLTNKDGTKSKIEVPEGTTVSVDAGKGGRVDIAAAGQTEATPTPVAKQEPETAPHGWVQLFNGKDLTGWKSHPDQPGEWKVRNGVLVGSRVASYLFSDADHFANFHLRLEAKINSGGDSGIFLRSPFATRPGRVADSLRPAGGYEVELHRSPGHQMATGSLWNAESTGPPKVLWKVADGSLTKDDEWFVLEIIAQGNHFITKVNGTQTADCMDPDHKFRAGHLALQVLHPQTVVQFKRIEIKELPASSPSPAIAPFDAAQARAHQEAWAKHFGVPVVYTNSIGMEFVIVPKGKSWLGGGKDKMGDKEVEIPADFYLGKYEVTQEEWTQVMGENPSWFSRTRGGKDAVKDISDADLKRFPVETVSWDECQRFVAKLNQQEKETGWVYRLPKATEWEYACRGGPMTDKADSAFDFYFATPTNNPLREREDFGRNKGLNRTVKVGSNESNGLGLFDMHRNVWEWCDDIKEAAGGNSQRVQMGGGWNHIRWRSAAANIESELPSHRSNALGLRLARVPSGTVSPEAKTPQSAVAPFPDADIQRIAALPAADQVEEVRKELKKRNPEFDGTLTPTIENDVVTGIAFFTNQVSDISPVRAFPHLTSLNCRADGSLVGMVSDLKPLKGMQLIKLTLSVNPVSNLTPLKGMPLADLHIDNSQVADLSPLEGMPLKVLNCSYTKVTSLVPLKGVPLTILWANNTEIADLSPVKGKPLEWITIQETKVNDLSPLNGMPLTQIYLNFKPERDTELLRAIRTLEKINDKPAAEFWKELEQK